MHNIELETSAGRFTIRPYDDSDETAVLALWQVAFGRPLDRKWWRWKYIDGPFGHQMLVTTADSGEIVCLYSGIPYPAYYNDTRVKITHLMDNMSHPAFRGVIGGRRGLFVRTAEAFFDVYGGPHASVLLYGFPGGRHFLLGQKVLHYQPLPGGFTYLTAETGRISSGFKGFIGRLRRYSKVSASFDRLAGELQNGSLSVIRDSTFLNWRFLSHPFHDYYVVGYHDRPGEEVRGYAVILVRDERAVVVDFLLPPVPSVALDFLGCLGYEMSAHGVATAEVWLSSNHLSQSIWLDAGFCRQPEPIGAIPTYRTFGAPFTPEWAAEHLAYNMADGDLF